MNYLCKTIGCTDRKIKYGLNKLTDNIYLMASIANYHKLHTTSPNEYETYIISKFLELDSTNRDKACDEGFFTYMTENISERYEMMNALYDAKMFSSTVCSEYLNYACKNFENNWKIGDYASVLDDYRALFSLKTFSLPNLYFKNITYSLKMLNLNNEQISDYFSSCTSTALNKVSLIIKEIKSGYFIFNKVLHDFENIVINLHKNSDIVQCYNESFSTILNAVQEREIPSCQNFDFNPTLKYVILSKTLSSSNSIELAKQFDNNNSYIVSDICNLIGFNKGFARFILCKNSKDQLISHTVDFFFKNLIGFSTFRSVAQFKQISTAYDYSHRTNNQREYAKQIVRISIVLANIIQTNDSNKQNELIRLLGSELIRLISIAMDLPLNKYLVFQRLTHVGMENCVDYLNFINEKQLDNACFSV